MNHPFPSSLVIELHEEPGISYAAKGTHVNNTPVTAFGMPPVVVQTFGTGQTPIEALECLLNNIVRGEATGCMAT